MTAGREVSALRPDLPMERGFQPASTTVRLEQRSGINAVLRINTRTKKQPEQFPRSGCCLEIFFNVAVRTEPFHRVRERRFRRLPEIRRQADRGRG